MSSSGYLRIQVLRMIDGACPSSILSQKEMWAWRGSFPFPGCLGPRQAPKQGSIQAPSPLGANKLVKRDSALHQMTTRLELHKLLNLRKTYTGCLFETSKLAAALTHRLRASFCLVFPAGPGTSFVAFGPLSPPLCRERFTRPAVYLKSKRYRVHH
jgi:hypothetical protein